MKNNKTILIVGGLVLAAGAVYLLTRKKDEVEATTAPTPTTTTPPPTTKRDNVIVDNKDVSLYSQDGKKITRKTASDNEVVGPFLNYKTLNGRVYVVFNDRFNNGLRSIVLKSSTNYKTK